MGKRDWLIDAALQLCIALVVLVVGAWMLMGCTHPIDWRQLGRDEASCATEAAKGAISTAADEAASTIDSLINQGVLPDSKQAAATWENFATKYGFATAACAIEHLIGDVFLAGPVPTCRVPHNHRVNAKHYDYLQFARFHIHKRGHK